MHNIHTFSQLQIVTQTHIHASPEITDADTRNTKPMLIHTHTHAWKSSHHPPGRDAKSEYGSPDRLPSTRLPTGALFRKVTMLASLLESPTTNVPRSRNTDAADPSSTFTNDTPVPEGVTNTPPREMAPAVAVDDVTRVFDR
jgi:hypothetical protein